MASREEKRQARIDRYKKLAIKAECASSEACERSINMVSVIPMGQPILVGHHSEKAHRSLLNRSWKKMGESVRLGEKAEYYNRKAQVAENNDAIYVDDENAPDKIKRKIEELEKLQEAMKLANKIVRDKSFSEQEKIERLIYLGFDEQNAEILLVPDCFKNIGFAQYSLSNNSANIRRYKQRLTDILDRQSQQSKEYMIGDVKVYENVADNRLQLFFPDKPQDEMRRKLKHNAFRWSPINTCWQSYLNKIQIRRASDLLKVS